MAISGIQKKPGDNNEKQDFEKKHGNNKIHNRCFNSCNFYCAFSRGDSFNGQFACG